MCLSQWFMDHHTHTLTDPVWHTALRFQTQWHGLQLHSVICGMKWIILEQNIDCFQPQTKKSKSPICSRSFTTSSTHTYLSHTLNHTHTRHKPYHCDVTLSSNLSISQKLRIALLRRQSWDVVSSWWRLPSWPKDQPIVSGQADVIKSKAAIFGTSRGITQQSAAKSDVHISAVGEEAVWVCVCVMK